MLAITMTALAVVATPCAGLNALSTPQATVAAEVVPPGVFPPAAPGAPAAGGARGGGRWRGGRPAGAAPADSAALPCEADAEAVGRLRHLQRAVDADRAVERQAARRRQRPVRWIDPGLRRHA